MINFWTTVPQQTVLFFYFLIYAKKHYLHYVIQTNKDSAKDEDKK